MPTTAHGRFPWFYCSTATLLPGAVCAEFPRQLQNQDNATKNIHPRIAAVRPITHSLLTLILPGCLILPGHHTKSLKTDPKGSPKALLGESSGGQNMGTLPDPRAPSSCCGCPNGANELWANGHTAEAKPLAHPALPFSHLAFDLLDMGVPSNATATFCHKQSMNQ